MLNQNINLDREAFMDACRAGCSWSAVCERFKLGTKNTSRAVAIWESWRTFEDAEARQVSLNLKAENRYSLGAMARTDRNPVAPDVKMRGRFEDDLKAIADKGSAGRPYRELNHSPYGSSAAWTANSA